MSAIRTWSFSRLQIFEQCALRAKLQYVDKVPEPFRPLPPGKTEHANDRGSRIHDAGETYVNSDIELIPELQLFAPEFKKLRTLYRQGKVSLEGEWAVDRDWEPTKWMSADVWARIKLDAFVMLSKTEAVVIDYKTGKRYGNEIKHAEQCQLYQLAAFLRYPELETIHVELWYTDQDEISYMKYTRAQGMRFFNNFNNRGDLITSTADFQPRPNIFSCKWCPYGPKGTGHCSVGV